MGVLMLVVSASASDCGGESVLHDPEVHDQVGAQEHKPRERERGERGHQEGRCRRRRPGKTFALS